MLKTFEVMNEEDNKKKLALEINALEMAIEASSFEMDSEFEDELEDAYLNRKNEKIV